MSVSNHLAVDRWRALVENGVAPTGKSGRVLSMEGSSIFARGDTIYSYGTHFPMAEVVRNKDGSVRVIVQNGDRYSVTTARHQSQVRAAVGRTGHPTIIVPFTALDAAGIDRSTIRPVEVRPDRNEELRHSSEDPPGPLVDMDDPSGELVVKMRLAHGTKDKETGIFYESVSQYGPIYGLPESSRGGWVSWPEEDRTPDDYTIHEERPWPDAPNVLEDKDGWHEWYNRYQSHTSTKVPYRTPARVPNPDRCTVGRNQHLYADRDEDGVWRWTTHRHWLGDSCFTAQVVTTRRRTEYGPRVYYGSSEDVPEGAMHVDEARERGWSRIVERGPDGDIANYAANVDVIQRRRTGYYLSSFDYQEARPLYFLCELPRRARPTSVDEAYACLRPPEVVDADEAGRDVVRQGDVFGVSTDLTTREVKKILRRGEAVVKRRHVLGTEHSCTEVALCKGGEVYGRGVMYHDVGEWRERDHARRKMGDGRTWYKLVRNTVPRQR